MHYTDMPLHDFLSLWCIAISLPQIDSVWFDIAKGHMATGNWRDRGNICILVDQDETENHVGN